MASRPYLLSTSATLRKFRILDYDGYDFSMRRANRRKYTDRTMKKLVLQYLYGVIVPNAIIAKGSFCHSAKRELNGDVMRALGYAMTAGRSREDREAFKLFFESEKNGWYFEHVTRPVHFFVLDLAYSRKKQRFADECLPEDRRWDIHRYVLEKLDTRGLRKYEHTGTPALNRLINAYARDRDLALCSRAQLRERFGCSNDTIGKFRAYLAERSGNGIPDSFLVIPRKERSNDHAAGTAAARTA